VISQIWEETTAKRMKIDLYCQRQNCSPVNVLFSDYVDIVSVSPLGVDNQNTVGENGDFIFNLYKTRKYLANGK